jgi:hypothetical protein
VGWKTFGSAKKTAVENRLKTLVSCELLRRTGTKQCPVYSLTDLGEHAEANGWVNSKVVVRCRCTRDCFRPPADTDHGYSRDS